MLSFNSIRDNDSGWLTGECVYSVYSPYVLALSSLCVLTVVVGGY